jgi:hypothetical protein
MHLYAPTSDRRHDDDPSNKCKQILANHHHRRMMKKLPITSKRKNPVSNAIQKKNPETHRCGPIRENKISIETHYYLSFPTSSATMTYAGKFSAAVVALATAVMITPSTSFVMRPPAPVSTRLYLEDWVADLIDKELYRQGHKKDFEAEWMEKNRAAVFSKIETEFGPISDTDETDFRMHYKDKKMAENDPERYCADRCIATGNCDIFEDL